MSAALRGFAKSYVATHPRESGRILETLPADQAARFLSELPQADLSRVLAAVDLRFALAYLSQVSTEERVAVLSALPMSSAALIARQLAPAEREQLIRGLPQERRHSLEVTLRHPDDSAGAIADPSTLTLYDDWAVEQALARIREEDVPVPGVLLVLDRHRRLRGTLTLGQLLTADPKNAVGGLDLQVSRGVTADTPASTLVTDSRHEPVAVVDNDGTVIGVVTAEAQDRLGLERQRSSIVHPIAALGELYWIGLREALGGLSSGRPRELETAGGKDGER